MPLVRLEVENFKSYRGKQTIGPFHTFSAVIGPNGSGKSNLMDAISFVLGVQSAQLRSSQLKDLIYRGGAGDEADEEGDGDGDAEEGRRGSERAAARASVTAVYQDQDDTEYHFKRSVTSSGASEYRVNNRVLLANAYNERLKAFNILVKAKNFLVFQGDVEAIASQNPKDLSRLVDQISGSLEYKEDYEAAKIAQERAFENQKYALFKRKGMSTELNFFKGQKNEAERFKRLQEERDDHVLHHVLWTLFHHDKKITQKKKEYQKASAKIPTLRRQLQEAEKAVKKTRSEHAQVAGKILEQRKSIRAKEKEAEKQQPELDAMEEKIKIIKDKIASAEKIAKAVEPEVERYRVDIEELERDYGNTKQAADLAAQEQASASAARGLSLSEDDLATYHSLKAEANVRATTERQKLETLSRDIKAKRGVVQSLQDKLSEAQKKREKLEEERGVLSERKSSVEQRRRETQQSLSALRSAMEAVEKRKAEVREQEERLNVTLTTCLAQLTEASSFQREQEKEVKKRETVIDLQRTFAGVHGRLAELCRPTQRKYDVAISTILGRNADAIVVDTQRDATECIQYLKRSRMGQATFLPLDSLQVKEINDRLRSIAPGARLAFDVIQFDTKLERAMQYACGNALVCDSMAIARSICYDRKQEVKAVTLEGTVIHKSGLISGGQTEDSRARRWEDREVQGLIRQREDCLAQLNILGKERHELYRQTEGATQVGRLEAELGSINDDFSSVDKRLTGVQDEITALSGQISQLSPRLEAAQGELDESVKQTRALQETVDGEDDVVFAAFCRRIKVVNIREYEERQLKLMQQQNDARMEYEQQLKRLENAIRFNRDRLREQQARLEHNVQMISKRNADLTRLRGERKALREVMEGIVGEMDAMKEEMKQTQEREAEASRALQEDRKRQDQARAALDANAKEIASLQLDLELVATDRLKLYRRCRLEEIALPLLAGSKKLKEVPLEKQVSLVSPEGESMGDDSMDLDEQEEEESQGGGDAASIQVPDHGIKVDFSDLTKAEKQDGSDDMARELESRIEAAASELEKMSPNVKANDRLLDTENRLAEVDGEFDKARREAKKAQDEFTRLKRLRCDLFNKAFNHISSKIDRSYKELTKSKTSPKGGSAYLVLENEEEPYLAGLQFSAIPPAKTFRGIDHLSGGEKTMAAIALLFAIQSVFPAPFIVLDEVDAALDSTNVQRVADYIRMRASKELQFIVISHKASLYERSSALVGVMRNQQKNSSATLTLDLEQYA